MSKIPFSNHLIAIATVRNEGHLACPSTFACTSGGARRQQSHASNAKILFRRFWKLFRLKGAILGFELSANWQLAALSQSEDVGLFACRSGFQFPIKNAKLFFQHLVSLSLKGKSDLWNMGGRNFCHNRDCFLWIVVTRWPIKWYRFEGLNLFVV